MGNNKFVVDISKPPLPPPRITWIEGYGEAAESIQLSKDYDSYYKEYYRQFDAAKKIKKELFDARRYQVMKIVSSKALEIRDFYTSMGFEFEKIIAEDGSCHFSAVYNSSVLKIYFGKNDVVELLF